MALQASGQMSFADVYNEITGESLANPPISITAAELGQLQNSQGQTIPLNSNSEFKPDGTLPTIFPTEWYKYCQICNVAKPFLTISKSAPSQAYNNQNFSFTITITNNGQASTSGIIFVTDNLQTNLVYQSISGTNWSGSVANNVVALQFNGTLAIGQSTQVTIVVKTVYNATYNNYASVTGGGDSIVRYSNTTTTQVITQTWTSTQTLRLDRTYQKNDCGGYGTGTYEQIFSPYYTNTYTSVISQADADSIAYQMSYSQASSWLDANGQAQANAQGSCVYQYPVVQITLAESPSTINKGSTGTVTLNVTNQVVATNGNITFQMTLPAGVSYNGIISVPNIYSVNVSGQVVSFTTSQSLSSTYSASLSFSIYCNTEGSYNFKATGSGGNMQNNYCESNYVYFNVVSQPSYSFGVTAENFSYDDQIPNVVTAVPTDDVYYTSILTITNGNSGTDALGILCFLPAFYPGNQAQVNLDSNYFQYTWNVLQQRIEIGNKVNNVPVGQYYFRIKLPMNIDYFKANKTGVYEVTINSNNQLITYPNDTQTSWYFYKNNTFINQGNFPILFRMNYLQRYSFNFTNTPNTTNGLQIRYQHIYNSSIGVINLTPQGSGLLDIPIWFLDPTRDWSVTPISYPLLKIINGKQYWVMYTYITILYNNQSIKFTTNRNDYDNTQNTGINILVGAGDPFTRPITLTIQVDSNGNFINN